MIANLATSTIRTLSAYAVAWLLSLKLAGPVLDLFDVGTATAKERLTALLVFVLGTVYYIVVRALEEKWPQLGVLLGAVNKPVYGTLAVAPTTPDGAHVITTAADPDDTPPPVTVDGILPPTPDPSTTTTTKEA